jgi:hypothetical protein
MAKVRGRSRLVNTSSHSATTSLMAHKIMRRRRRRHRRRRRLRLRLPNGGGSGRPSTLTANVGRMDLVRPSPLKRICKGNSTD